MCAGRPAAPPSRPRVHAHRRAATDFAEPQSFCPMRLLKPAGELRKKSDEFELVTFGLGQKRCIGEKMARAMICSFLCVVLPTVDAESPDQLPEDGFFDLIPASELRLYGLHRRTPPPDEQRSTTAGGSGSAGISPTAAS